MNAGRVVRSVGGYHDVLCGGRTYTCTARGRLKRAGGEILVGDLVGWTMDGEAGVIERIEPRRNVLRRPLVANVDQAVLVFALREPDPNTLTIDRFLVAVKAAGLPVLLCLNKKDLVRPAQALVLAEYYRSLGQSAVVTSTVTREGRNKLLAALHGRTTVLCGPSGAGKSALLNMVGPGYGLATGEVSARIGRGRHTTRAARLLPVGRGGFVVDTPGFTRIDFADLTLEGLRACFPELAAHAAGCKYDGCLHLAEPGCAVKAAVAEGLVPGLRYDHYRAFAAELDQKGPDYRRKGGR